MNLGKATISIANNSPPLEGCCGAAGWSLPLEGCPQGRGGGILPQQILRNKNLKENKNFNVGNHPGALRHPSTGGEFNSLLLDEEDGSRKVPPKKFPSLGGVLRSSGVVAFFGGVPARAGWWHIAAANSQK